MTELSNQTHSIGRTGHPITGPTVPSCEIYGQMSLSPAPQIKTKLIQRQRQLFENVERHVQAEDFAQRLCYVFGEKGALNHDPALGSLVFDSNFESGNLYKVRSRIFLIKYFLNFFIGL